MDENLSRLGRREQQIIDLLLQGCDNSEIARNLRMAERTVKAYFNRLFVRFGIHDGIKRVKLATLIYRRQLWLESQQLNGTPAGLQTNANTSSFNSSPKGLRTGTLPIRSVPPNTSSRTISA